MKRILLLVVVVVIGSVLYLKYLLVLYEGDILAAGLVLLIIASSIGAYYITKERENGDTEQDD